MPKIVYIGTVNIFHSQVNLPGAGWLGDQVPGAHARCPGPGVQDVPSAPGVPSVPGVT